MSKKLLRTLHQSVEVITIHFDSYMDNKILFKESFIHNFIVSYTMNKQV